jgi:hypothetical protein
MPNRASVQLSVSNPFGAADLALHGSNNLHGWGMNPFPNQSLLYVRGFDAATNQYRYEVNQRFGATRPQTVTLRNPVVLTATIRYDLGASREEQRLTQQLDYGRTQPGSRYPESLYRAIATSSLPNPMSYLLALQDSLSLTSVQADSIASVNRRYNYQVDSIWGPVSHYFTELPVAYDTDEAWDRYLDARGAQIDLLSKLAPVVNGLLNSDQRRKVPASIQSGLDPRYLASIRSGSGLYVGAGRFGSGGSAIPPIGFAMAESILIIR